MFNIRQHLTRSTIGLASSLLLAGSAAAFTAPAGMTHIPAGPFVMGVDKTPTKDVNKMSHIQKLKYAVSEEAFHDEGPAHVVLTDDYFIDTHEVSNREFGAFMKATGHAAPAYWDDHRYNNTDQPVVGVNWFDANAYCGWANRRLPTEAEWEKAARGPEGTLYPWGNEINSTKANFGRTLGTTAQVAAFPEGKSGYGVYNMAGNAFEWVSDWYDPNYYKTAIQVMNPAGPTEPVMMGSTGTFVDRITGTGGKKVIRGGSWFAPDKTITTTHRFWNAPMNNSYGVGLGFRCAVNAEADSSLEARSLYMNALINIGAEKYAEALVAIDAAIATDPANAEYQTLRDTIKSQL